MTFSDLGGKYLHHLTRISVILNGNLRQIHYIGPLSARGQVSVQQ